MDEKLIVVANSLYDAQKNLETIAPPTDLFPNMSFKDAYQIQGYITRKRLQEGRRIVGRKIGATSSAMQKLFNLKEPDYGVLFDDLVFSNGSTIERNKMIQPMIEAEIGFLLKKDLPGPCVTGAQVIQACEGVVPCLEIIDSRIKDWKIKIQDTIADNASCWGVVSGPKISRPLDLDYRVLGLALYKNNTLVGTGAGAAVLGDPLVSVAWLANKLHEYGEMLKAGDLVLSGSFMAAVTIEKGDQIRALFDRIGEVTVSIS